ncbi:MAG: DNA polymerase III subunit gamma/tau [Cyanobium sp. 49614_E6]|nr:DNA polymerase III subunit gamma/tau [Cyanobium sp. 49614_E6]
MAYQPLHHKYRPQRLAELVGQQAIATTLANALRTGRIAPAYLFCGPRGTGKTSSARILARSLNCISSDAPTPEPCGHCEVCVAITAGNALDVIEIDAASNTGVDNIRELIERSRFAPVQARWKVYVIDECHMLSTAAFNALLKTLEEPPPRVVFVLATTDPQRVLPTILSRCQRFDFRRIPLPDLEGHLGWIAAQESIAISAEALNLVAQRAQGGLRDAESLLDQLSLLAPPIEAAAVWDLLGAVPEQELLSLADSMAAAEPLAVIETCRQLLERGREPLALLQGLASLLRDLLLAGIAPDRLELTSVSPQLRPELPPVARRIGKNRLLQWQAQLKGSEQQLRQSVQPRLWLEVLLLGLLAEPMSAGGPPAAVASVAAAPATPGAATPGVAGQGVAGQGVAAAAAPQAARETPPGTPRSAAHPITPQGASDESRAPETTPEPVQTASEPTPAPAPASTGGNLAEIWQQILAGLELPSTRMLLSQQATLHRLDERRAVVRVAANWLTMVDSRKSLLEKAMLLALGSARQVTLEPSDHPPANLAAVGPPASPLPLAPPTVAVVPQQINSHQPLAAHAIPAATASSEPQSRVEPKRQPPSPPSPLPPPPPQQQAATSAPQASAPAILGRLETSTRLLADFFQGEVIESSEADAIDNSGDIEQLPEAPIESIHGS